MSKEGVRCVGKRPAFIFEHIVKLCFAVYDAVYAMYVMLCSSPDLTHVYHQQKRLLVWLCKKDYD